MTQLRRNPDDDIIITRGRGLFETWYFQDDDGAAISLANTDVVIQVRAGVNNTPSPSGTLILEMKRISNTSSKITINNAAGTVVPSFTAADADLFTAGGDYWWDGYTQVSGEQPCGFPSDGPARWIVHEKISNVGGGS